MEGIPLYMQNSFRLLCSFCIGFILINLFMNEIFAETGFESEPSLINSYEEDITGDGFREYLKLHGNLLSNQSVYYPEVWLDITNPFSQHWKISLQAGYHPDIQFIDLDHDNVFDIFYIVGKDAEKRKYHYQLYTLKNGTIEQIQLPKHKFVQTKLMNEFKIEIKTNPHEKSIIHSIEDKNKYIEDEIYDKNGKLLLVEKKLQHKPIHFMEPVLISETNGYGLKTYEQIIGVFDEPIGEIQTLWYFNNDEWIALKTDWVTEQINLETNNGD